MQKRLQYIIAALHLAVIIFWLGGTTLFIHSHIIDGVDIVHSHPYAGSADDHSHTADNVLQISRMANVDMLIGEGSFVEGVIIAMHVTEGVDTAEKVTSYDASSVALRAPPVRA
ncbi:MAG: hypothetical protein IKB15_07185 [Alistipes sp.]|nr:hypothetical protein [Alistipes sp.]